MIRINAPTPVISKEQHLTADTNTLDHDVNYLRISITDRCNQRCFYCMPHSDLPLFRQCEILRYEEILTVVRAAVTAGFRKFRLTGGEPLMRKGVCELIRQMRAIAGVEEVVLTTNGVLLEKMASDLFAAGIRRLNISLDTLNPLKFQRITRRNHFDHVLRGIWAARKIGIDPVKINMVVIRGVNDDELEDFGRWAMRESLTVRFIEFMPIGRHTDWHSDKFIDVDDMRARLQRLAPLRALDAAVCDGPAQRYRLGASQGEIGLIGAVSQHFCKSCNRLRLTSEGRLRPCLLRDEEIDLRTPLRNGCDTATLVALIRKAIKVKLNRLTTHRSLTRCTQRSMSRIGG